jgi:hypothetical protein
MTPNSGLGVNLGSNALPGEFNHKEHKEHKEGRNGEELGWSVAQEELAGFVFVCGNPRSPVSHVAPLANPLTPAFSDFFPLCVLCVLCG